MAKKTKNEKQKTNPFAWFMIAIVFPVMVAVILAIIIFSLAGVNVWGWVKDTGSKIPVVSQMVQPNDEQVANDTSKQMEKKIEKKDKKIADLMDNVSNLESTIDKLQQKITKLESNPAAEPKKHAKDKKNKANKKIKDMSTSFAEMEPEQAAKVIEEMDAKLAITILKNVANDVRGEIFNEMDPEKTAELAKDFVNDSN